MRTYIGYSHHRRLVWNTMSGNGISSWTQISRNVNVSMVFRCASQVTSESMTIIIWCFFSFVVFFNGLDICVLAWCALRDLRQKQMQWMQKCNYSTAKSLWILLEIHVIRAQLSLPYSNSHSNIISISLGCALTM